MTAPHDENSTWRVTDGRDAPAQGFQLRVMSARGVASFTLPSGGTLTLGRGDTADLRVDDPSISRQHAKIHVGRTVQIEDVGSSNGTRVGARLLKVGERVDAHPGDALEFGRALGALQGPDGAEVARRLWSHDWFEARVDDECARAVETRGAFGVVRVRLESVGYATFDIALLATARPNEVVAVYGPREYEVLVEGVGADETARRALEWVDTFAQNGIVVRTGAASFPADGRSTARLLGRASAMLRGPGEAEAADDVVVEDPAMVALYEELPRIAQGGAPVLLRGEAGVGKEVVAERIHALSTRSSGPCARVRCVAFTDALLESELFGHEKGPFTGAASRTRGLLESASGGTVFLDEVGELSLAMQAKLLRVLDERLMRRVGSLDDRAVDVRFVAATSRDLDADVAAGRFREDLFARLRGVTLVIPPLRERPSELLALARRFADLAAKQLGHPDAVALSPEALVYLKGYAWPGNVRELRNVMERAVLLSDGGVIRAEHLPADRTSDRRPQTAAMVLPSSVGENVTVPARLMPESAAPKVAPLDDAERESILAVLERCGGNHSLAAQKLGMSRRALMTRLERFNLARKA